MSKIFEAYAKLAEERGLIKQAYPMEKRVESRQLSDIEILYGVKPNDDDDEDIVEKAHPETVVIAPAYDRMNGIVENVNQRHDIMQYIAQRPPNGLYQQKRFVTAKQDLLESLVRIGFMLDNKGEEDLMKLADSCAERLEKKAIAPALVIGGIALTLGLIALINRTDNSPQGVINNAESVIRELEDLQGKVNVSGMLSDMHYLQNVAKEFQQVASQTKIPVKNTMDVVDASKTHGPELKIANRYKALLTVMESRLPYYKDFLEKATVKEEYKYDWWKKIEDVGRTLFSIDTDTGDVIKALGGLAESISIAKEKVDEFMKKADDARPAMEAEVASYMAEQEGGAESQAPGPVSSLVMV